ncbi:DUF1127 domain-containing protein [Roseospira marina]|uniref:DUF1127 domain-containing protein n=1 Tax=Roseospira marina TaxID=140057 RepID=A0A5M6IBZ6_9PROT|nr:DUF1127 domain-containing protein [Roseospira marina]KAA5605776.1 DUF1127 domain-containing protein [Roseospira marina]MBB4313585.1 uncharacterized protein YjiS (DUF1127 family) [Roseospira marina]MBB5086747.1 uncharacterized protein YjiS (DUF1127 family) [Roseospira marina]
MWPYMETTRNGVALKQASAIGTVLSAPFVSLSGAAPRATAAQDADLTHADPMARHRWTPDEPHDASNDDHWYLHGVFGWMLRGLNGYLERRELEHTLLSMDAHQLTDIGLTRSDIPNVVAGRFHRGDRR